MESEENSLNDIEVNEEPDIQHHVKKQRNTFNERPRKEESTLNEVLELDASLITTVERHMFSRLLYTNPVCLLSSIQKENKNVMTISWLTPINNKVPIIFTYIN